MDYYYNDNVNSLFILLDEGFLNKWEDRHKDPYLAEQFYCIYDVLNGDNYIISCDDFEDDFILVTDENLKEYSDNILEYDIDELNLARIRKLIRE